MCLFKFELREDNNVYIEYEKVKCNLEECLYLYKNEEKKKMIISEIGVSLMKLHSLSSIHGNLNPSNIYVDDDNNIKLIDYFFQPNIEVSNYNNLYFQSLEVLLGKEYNESSDSWSFGCIIYYILTEEYLFSNKSIKALAKSIKHFSLKMPPYNNSTIFNILPYLLNVSPDGRISIEESLNLINRILY